MFSLLPKEVGVEVSIFLELRAETISRINPLQKLIDAVFLKSRNHLNPHNGIQQRF